MLHAPHPFDSNHDVAGFDCGVASLNNWLERRAAANQVSGASCTFVSCEGVKVVSYCALTSSAVVQAAAPRRLRRRMPGSVPVVEHGLLAAAASHHGQGLGRSLSHNAVSRVIHAADAIGIRCMVLDALSEGARAFYLRLGLEMSPLDSMTLMVTVTDLRAAVQP
jgi:GNAT superfamily N-acetyltransferase